VRLRNATTIPNALVREIIRFVKPSGVSGFDVRLGVAGCGSVVKGKAYYAGSGYHDTADPFVNLYLGNVRYPHPPAPPIRSNYLPRPYFADKVEALVYLTAHELRHLWQANVPRGRRVWGARGQFSERDADAYAIRMLRAWRRRVS
jgi:hypothetical protein